MNIRKPVVAGRFYPAAKSEIEKLSLTPEGNCTKCGNLIFKFYKE